ncbi:MAG: glycosyltransferase family 9 protein [Armatimonadetes bacterium]|nr:glycosyltransferase family 9 protein [Armatimonadota bacterium]
MSSPRILVIKMSAIGDCLMASPSIEALRIGHPEGFIGWILHPHCAPVARGNPFINHVHIMARKGMWRAMARMAKEMRSFKYDIALDQQGLMKSGLITRLSGAKSRFGPAEAREKAQIFYTSLVPHEPNAHVIEHYLTRAKAVGATWDPAAEPAMFFPRTDDDRQFASALLKEIGDDGERPLVAINPSAGKVQKLWPAERFGEIALRLARECGVRPIVTGAPADRELGDRVLAVCSDVALDAVGKSGLTQFAAILERCSLFVGADTGPMHISQAVGTPTLALFGPTSAHRLGPRLPQHRSIYHPGPMEGISVTEVFEAARTMLGES